MRNSANPRASDFGNTDEVGNTRATEVFTPGDFPEHTYVERASDAFEERLRRALETPGEVVSLSGPSKSGKTVLVERVVGADDLITVTGAGLQGGQHLWERVLDWMGAPTETASTRNSSVGGEASAGASGAVGIPLVAKGGVSGSVTASMSRDSGSEASFGRFGLEQVVKEIANSSFVVLIDDFHYMERTIQTEVAQQIKEAARRGVKICTASVPHRSDDIVRSNPELRGRVQAIDLEYWTVAQLLEIAQIGFPILNVDVQEDAARRLAEEASGSPQLMQASCLDFCFEFGFDERADTMVGAKVDRNSIERVLRRTSSRTDFKSLARRMHTGPKTRGTERKEYEFSDGSIGDVYRCVLFAICSDPPKLSFSYNELQKRIQVVTKSSELPRPQSVYQCCSQLAQIALEMYEKERVLEWDEDASLLDIIDPYLLFYLRWSDALHNLGQA